jgi:uncharacterized protein YqeY
MSVKDQLHTSLTAAMKARDEVQLTALRQALAAIATAETAGKEAVTLDDGAVLALVATEVRKYHETADAFAGGGRAEQAEGQRAYAAVLEAYLPTALSAAELQALIDAEVAAAAADGATGMKAMGRVVSAVRAKAGPTADGAAIAAAVKATLGA